MKIMKKSENRKKTRAVILILLLSLIIFAFTACNSNSDKDAKTNSPTSDVSDSSGVDADNNAEKPEFNPPKENYDNSEFRILGFNSFDTAWVAVNYSEIEAETIDADPINDAIFERTAKIEELFNVKIKEVMHGEMEDYYFDVINKTVKLINAGDVNFDIAFSTGSCLPNLFAVANAMYDLNTIPGLDFNKSWWNQNSIDEFTLGGKLCVATGDITMWRPLATVVFFFNKKLLADNGLENPYNLVREGKWTWNKLVDMAKEAVYDLNGDNKIDRNDQIGLASTDGMLSASVITSGERFTLKDEDGMPALNMNFDKISSIIDKVYPLVRNDEYTYATTDLYGRYAHPFFEYTMPKFRDNQTLFYEQQLMVALDLRGMEADFGILPYPKLDEAQTEYYSMTSDWFLKYVWIPTSNDDTDKAVNIIQALGYYGQQIVIPAVFDVTITGKVVRDEDSLEMLELINNTQVYDIISVYNWGGMMGIYSKIFTKRNNNLISELDKNMGVIEAALQATIDELLS